MAVTSKAYELRQSRAKLLDANRELIERAEKENRGLSPDEQAGFDRDEKESRTLAERISNIERLEAVEKTGADDPERRSRPLPHEDPAATRNGKHRYSLIKAIRQCANSRQHGTDHMDGLELEVSQELAKRTGKTPQGFMMPYSLRGYRPADEQRALDTTAGAGSIPTILDKDWIELLRNAMKVKIAGAREIMDLQGKFAIPRQNAAATGYWVAESGAPTGSNQTLDQVLFTPHTVGAFTDISRRFFELTILESGEEFVKMDLTAVIARAVDLAALNGSGTNNQPLGILQNTAITATRTVALGTNGGAPSWPALVEMHTIVARGNAADLGATAYLGNADVVGTTATTPKVTGATPYPIFLLEDGRIYGKPLLETNQLPNNLTKGTGTGLSPIVYGVWNQLILAYWSGIDILVDPYTGSSSGTVRVVALQDMDIQVRHNEAFSVIMDMVSNQTQ